MASLARILGSLCMIIAVAFAGLVTYAYVVGPDPAKDYGEFDSVANDLALTGLLISLGFALVLATIGATAVVAGNAYKRLERDLHRNTGRQNHSGGAPQPGPPPWQAPTGPVRTQPVQPVPMPAPPVAAPPVPAPPTAPPPAGPPPVPPPGGQWQPPPGYPPAEPAPAGGPWQAPSGGWQPPSGTPGR